MKPTRTSKRMKKSTAKYLDDLFENTSRLLVVRVDLSYRKEHAAEASLNDSKEDFAHMLNNRRTKPSIFENNLGYIAKHEYTEEKGPHIHSFFFYDGHKVAKDAHKGDQIGKYWNGPITGGRGIHHNCNREKERYQDCALGMVDHTDQAKRTVLTDKAIAYLCKDEQSIDGIKESGHDRAFTRGIAPRRKSNAGRPRMSDTTANAGSRILTDEDGEVPQD